eukprot:1263868-Pyramimonas_sp.AAC.1
MEETLPFAIDCALGSAAGIRSDLSWGLRWAWRSVGFPERRQRLRERLTAQPPSLLRSLVRT